MNPWQKNRKKTKDFFLKKQEEGLSLSASPWTTLAVGKELQNLVIDGIIRDGMTGIDIGCGIGIEAMYLAKQGIKATGLDFMPKSIEIAKEMARLSEADVNFLCDDFIEMNLKKYQGKFDLVIDQGCFHHIPIEERINYAERVYSLLSDDGIFFLRGFSDQMLPSPTNDGPIRLTSDAIINTFYKLFFIEKLYRFKNIPLPNSNKPQVFWAFLGKKRFQ
jgi:2-polyprenyl-3-methyl-5-hydroxy-6-metoxy-1,4-benzoquinol methylase